MKLLDEEGFVPILEACIIGMVAGASAVVLSTGVSWLGALRVHLADLFGSPLVLPLFGLIGGLISGLLVQMMAPEASGSGIPQVRARLDRMIMPLNLRIAVVKLIGGTIALGSGLFMGREGPTVQLGAALAAPLSRLLPTTAERKRQLIAAGAGAGLTAAFNAPLAGVTFVLEELLKEIKASTIAIAVVACSISCLVLNVLAPPVTHPLFPPHAHPAVPLAIEFAPIDVPFYLVLGVLCGVGGAIFNAAVIGSLNFNRQVLRMPVALRVGLAGLISGALISVLPDNFHDFAGLKRTIITGDISFLTAMVAFLEFYLLTLVAYGSGAPGGLFAPTLVLGSALGLMVGCMDQIILGSGSLNTFAMIGMGAFFSGVARTPLTAIVITFEMSSSFALLTPLMITCVISSAMGDLIYKGGLYDLLMRWNGINLRGPATSENLRSIKAEEVMQKTVESLSSQSLVKDVLHVFGNSTQRGFPVVEKGELVGVITETDLAKLKQAESAADATIAHLMTPHPVAVSPDDSLDDILFLFSRYKFTWLPVTTKDELVGIILQRDVLKALLVEKTKEVSAETAVEKPKEVNAEIAVEKTIAVSAETDVEKTIETSAEVAAENGEKKSDVTETS